MLSSSQSHAAITNYCRNGETVVRQWLRSSPTNKINKTSRNRASPDGNGFIWLWAGGWTGSVAAMGGDSMSVSQTDAGQPLAAAAWLVIHGAVAGMSRESLRMSSAWQRRMWSVIH